VEGKVYVNYINIVKIHVFHVKGKRFAHMIVLRIVVKIVKGVHIVFMVQEKIYVKNAKVFLYAHTIV
jgi:hypothetical protein